MAMKKYLKNIPLLFAIGLICLIYGLGRLYVPLHFDLSGLLLAAIGVVCIFTCFWRIQGDGHPWGAMIVLRAYAPWVAMVIVLAAAVVGINYLAYRTDWRWDLTRARQHTLSQYTTEILHNLNDTVDVIAFHVGLPPKYLEDLFQEYTRVSGGKVKTAILDPLVDIGYAAQFGNVISGKEKKVIVQSPTGRKDIDFTEDLLAEEQVTNALLQVTRKVRRVYFLTEIGRAHV